MSGSRVGRSVLVGDGLDLLGKTPHKVSIADHIDHRFSLDRFVESACWLNDNVGKDDWCYDGMIYHFRDLEDLLNFKLRYLFGE